jgi:dTDP-4-dehydrorhamnose reductase
VETIKEDLSWLIIGAKGQLGSELVQELANREHSFSAPKKLDLNITNREQVFGFLQENRPKIVVNSAAWTDVERAESFVSDAYNVNANGPLNLAHACKIFNIQLVHISTDYVFSGKADIPWEIKSIKEPISEYGKSKSAGEDYILQHYDAKSLIFRTSWLYSKYERNFVKSIITKAIKSKDPINVVRDQFGSPTSARDLSIRIIECVEKSVKPAIYHASNSGEASWYEFGRYILELIGEDPNRVKPILTKELKTNVKRPSYSVLGQECWKNTGLLPMRNWKLALSEQISEIRDTVHREVQYK